MPSTAKKGFNYHEKLIALYPSFLDAYLGPGLKNLMVSALPWVFKPLLYLVGLSGTEDKADEYLTIAYEKGQTVHLESGGYLAQLCERRKDWNRSRMIYADLLKRYPYRVLICVQSLEPFYASKEYGEVVDRCKAMMYRFENDRHVFTRADSLSMLSVITSAGYAYCRQERDSDAIAHYEAALTNKSYKSLNRWRLHWSLGGIYRDPRKTREARNSYEIAQATSPERFRKNLQKELDNLPSIQ